MITSDASEEDCVAVCEEHDMPCNRRVHPPEQFHSHEYGIMICDFVAVD